MELTAVAPDCLSFAETVGVPFGLVAACSRPSGTGPAGCAPVGTQAAAAERSSSGTVAAAAAVAGIVAAFYFVACLDERGERGNGVSSKSNLEEFTRKFFE